MVAAEHSSRFCVGEPVCNQRKPDLMPTVRQELDARVAERLVNREPMLLDDLGNDGAGFLRQLDLRTAAILVCLEPAQKVLH
jgi:hypothetical protein